MKKAVVVKAKANLQFLTTTEDINEYYLWGSRIAYMKNQSQSIVDTQEEKPKVLALEVLMFDSSNLRSFAKVQKEKKTALDKSSRIAKV